jgi:IPT/TIG domain
MSTRPWLARLFVVGLLSIVLAVHIYGGICAPTVTGVSPNTGPTAGGTAVTVTGTNFFAPMTVTFGGVAATNVVVVNGTTLTATTPAHAAGAVDVVVQTCGTTNSPPLPNGFTYQAAAAIPTFSPLTLAALAGILALVGALVIKR